MNLRTILPLVMAGALSLGTGCAKQEECSKAIDSINSTGAKLEKLASNVQDGDSKKMVEASKAFAAGAKEEAGKLAKLNITTEELKPHYQAYVKMVEDTGTAADKLAKVAQEAHDLTSKSAESTKSFESVIEGLKKACTQGAPDCAAVGEVLLKEPKEQDDKKLAAAMRAWVKEMDQLKVEDEAVSKALNEVKKMLNTQIELMEKAVKMQADMEAASKELDKAIEPEDKLINDINKTCGAG